ncbi:MAG: multidrug efflux SMR transporter [Pacificimonas sp.]
MAIGAWAFLGLAISLEVAGTFLLKLSDGFRLWHWGGLSILCYSSCFWVLAPAMKVLPIGVVYAIWAGVGIVAAALLGAFVFGERLGGVQLGCMALVLVGAIGLRLTTTA